MAPGAERLEDRAVEDVRPDGLARREAEEDDEDRRHERASADAGEADDEPKAEADEDVLPAHDSSPRSLRTARTRSAAASTSNSVMSRRRSGSSGSSYVE